MLKNHWGKMTLTLFLVLYSLFRTIDYTEKNAQLENVLSQQTQGFPWAFRVTTAGQSEFSLLPLVENILLILGLMLFLGWLSDRYLAPLMHKLSSPKHYYLMTGRWLPWLWGVTLLLLAYGLYGGLYASPADYQQGHVYRIIYIHVPSAWMSMMVYLVMAVAAFVSIVWRIKMADVVLISSAPIGAIFTFLALVTGAVWGYPTWGTWWTWDLRLTSELVLLFIYLGIIALYSSYEDKRTASRAVAVLTLVCVVNIPIIHYAIEWLGEKTLHQGNSVAMGKSSMDTAMLIPLLVMAFAFKFLYAAIVIMRSRTEVLQRESNSQWVEEVLEEAV